MSRRFAAALAFFFFAVRGALFAAPPDPASIVLGRAGTAYAEGRYEDARAGFARIIIDFPGSALVPEATFFLAESEAALGDPAAALRRYQTVLSLYPDSPRCEAALYRCAEIAFGQGRREEALARIEELAGKYPRGEFLPRALRTRGTIQFEAGRLAAATAAWSAALGRAVPGSGEAQELRYSLGLASAREGRAEEAALFFGSASEGPSAVIAEQGLWLRTVLLLQHGGRLEARASLESFLQSYPDSGRREECLRLLAAQYEDSGDTAEAAKAWAALTREYSHSSSLSAYLFHAGYACLETGSFAEALEDFQRILRDFPRSEYRGEATYAIGVIYGRQGELARAVPFFRSVLSADPSEELAWRSRLAVGICWFNLGLYEKALASFTELSAEAGGGRDGGLLLNLARTLYRLARLPDAALRYREAAAALGAGGDPRAAEALYWLGWSLYRAGALGEAVDAFAQGAREFPRSPWAAGSLLQAGISAVQQGDDSAAVGFLDEALKASAAGEQRDVREKALYEKAWALHRLGRSADRDAAFDTLWRGFPGTRLAAESMFKRASLALDQDNPDEAARYFTRLYREYPASPLAEQAAFWTAEAASRAGRPVEAAVAFWVYFHRYPNGSLLSTALDGFQAALEAADDLSLGRTYWEWAKTESGLPVEVRSLVELDYARMLQKTDPVQARMIVQGVLDLSGRGADVPPGEGAPPGADVPPGVAVPRGEGVPSDGTLREARFLLGICLQGEGRLAEARAVFIDLSGPEGDRVAALAWMARARIAEVEGDTREAMELFAATSSMYPDFQDLGSEGLFHAARLARLRGELETALKLEQVLVEGFPESPWAEEARKLMQAAPDKPTQLDQGALEGSTQLDQAAADKPTQPDQGAPEGPTQPDQAATE